MKCFMFSAYVCLFLMGMPGALSVDNEKGQRKLDVRSNLHARLFKAQNANDQSSNEMSTEISSLLWFKKTKEAKGCQLSSEFSGVRWCKYELKRLVESSTQKKEIFTQDRVRELVEKRADSFSSDTLQSFYETKLKELAKQVLDNGLQMHADDVGESDMINIIKGPLGVTGTRIKCVLHAVRPRPKNTPWGPHVLRDDIASGEVKTNRQEKVTWGNIKFVKVRVALGTQAYFDDHVIYSQDQAEELLWEGLKKKLNKELNPDAQIDTIKDICEKVLYVAVGGKDYPSLSEKYAEWVQDTEETARKVKEYLWGNSSISFLQQDSMGPSVLEKRFKSETKTQFPHFEEIAKTKQNTFMPNFESMVANLKLDENTVQRMLSYELNKVAYKMAEVAGTKKYTTSLKE